MAYLVSCVPLGYSTNGGYENVFVEEPPDRLVCSICLYPCRDAHMSVCCGHNFCRSCLVSATAFCGDSICPVCRAHFTAFINKQADREIRSLRVYCVNRGMSCTWEGELNDFGTHVSTCLDQFVSVQCPNQCGKMMQRLQITSHVENECSRQKIECQYCDTLDEKRYIEGSHKLLCPKQWAPCPNKCNTKFIPYCGIAAHREKCPLELVECKYRSVGCDAKIARSKTKEHEEEKMKAHLRMTRLKLSKKKAKLSEMEAKLDALEATVARVTADHGPQVHIDVPHYSSLREANVDWYSAVFVTHHRGYKMKLNIVCNGHDSGTDTHISAYLCNLPGPYDGELCWPLRGEFTITLFKDGLEDYSRKVDYNDSTPDSVCRRMHRSKHNKTYRISDAKCSTRGWGVPQFISHDDASRYLNNSDQLSFIIWFDIGRMT